MVRSWFLMLFLAPFLFACTCSTNQKNPASLRTTAGDTALVDAYSNQYPSSEWDVVESQSVDLNGDEKPESLIIFLAKNKRRLQLAIYDKKENAVTRVSSFQVPGEPQGAEVKEEYVEAYQIARFSIEDVNNDKIPEILLHYSVSIRDKVIEERKAIYSFHENKLSEILDEQTLFRSPKGERRGAFSFETLKDGRIVLNIHVTTTIPGDLPLEKTRRFLWHPKTWRFEEVVTIRQENE